MTESIRRSTILGGKIQTLEFLMADFAYFVRDGLDRTKDAHRTDLRGAHGQEISGAKGANRQ